MKATSHPRRAGQDAAVLLLFTLSGLLCAPGELRAADDAAQAAANQAEASAAEQSAPASRIGVVLLRDESGDPALAERLTEMLAARLSARFAGSEFVVLDPLAGQSEKSGSERSPLLLAEAVALGQREGVAALLDGSFGGVEIAGGVWPSLTADFPQARGFLRWRVVDCQQGLLIADGEIRPKSFKTYPQRLRTEKELIARVLGDLCDSVGDALEEAGTQPAEQDDSGAAGA